MPPDINNDNDNDNENSREVNKARTCACLRGCGRKSASERVEDRHRARRLRTRERQHFAPGKGVCNDPVPTPPRCGLCARSYVHPTTSFVELDKKRPTYKCAVFYRANCIEIRMFHSILCACHRHFCQRSPASCGRVFLRFFVTNRCLCFFFATLDGAPKFPKISSGKYLADEIGREGMGWRARTPPPLSRRRRWW